MKNILFLLALFATSFTAQAQQVQWINVAPAIYNNSFAAVSADTLKGVDTTYNYYSFSAPYHATFNVKLVQKADSVSGTAVLQATNDPTGTNWLTYDGSNVTWQAITGLTTVCTSCTGASATLTKLTGTNYVKWDVGYTPFKYWRIRIVGTRSTDTTAVTSFASVGY